MIDQAAIKDTLLDNPKVSNINVQGVKTYMGISYECLISCDLLISGTPVSVFIGITDEWEQNLINVYIEDYIHFPYIPHVDVKGKLCLYELEGILIDTDLCGILNQCVQRAINILSDGLSKKNGQDFIKEFSSYWILLPGSRMIKFAVPADHATQVIKYIEGSVKHKRGEKYSAYMNRVAKAPLFAAMDNETFRTWQKTGTQRNGAFFHIHSRDYIFPPDPRQPLQLSFVNDLLKQVMVAECEKIICKCNGARVYIFEIVQPNGMCNCFGVYLKNVTFTQTNGFFQIVTKDTVSISPLFVQRIDKAFLINRTKDQSISELKKCLLIGCGSIGGYLCKELISAGIKDITLIDEDLMKEENIFRHFLGIEYVGFYKAEALVKYFEKNIPQLNLKAVDNNIQDLIDDGSIELTDYDFIISATGNHNVNRWLNKVIHNKHIVSPVFYVWNEPLDIGCHVAVISFEKEGCYECFFKRNTGTYELYDATAYSKPGQSITRNYTGCSGAFIPYGSTVSLKASAICMDLINRVLTGRCKENILVSLKGDGYYFKKAGYKTSYVYNQQKQNVEITTGAMFRQNFCEICG